ncbi:hypothetical protein BN8_02357 [Fibrisoma limi BUZ 3]|uniref:DUF3829 domain-containing protein n=1 Tax=Fibrisoma limi BUZ 3 TaxID=1185876 RepID=I2GHA0_9BACT|nr:hypothetical protein [Fibrisoma limi]CCH53275.1 hypothetical protein BN8_02357 [Fibrisoma limi BUZ 3]
MKLYYYRLFAVTGLFLTSCVNLKTVNTFGTSAVAGLQQNSALPTTFTAVYKERTLADSLSRHPFNRIPVIGPEFTSSIRQDSLRSYQLADSLTLAVSDLMEAYFQAIADFSVTGSTFAPVQLKSPAFNQYLQGSRLKLSSDQTAAANRLFNLLGSAATNAYRRRKLSVLITQSHDDAQQVLSALVFAYERLADVVAISRDQAYGHYRTLLIQDPTLTYTQKRELAKEWLNTSKAIDQTQQSILTHVQTLKTIQAGYREVYKNRYLLKSKELINNIDPYLSRLKQLKADLEQFNLTNGRLNPRTDR